MEVCSTVDNNKASKYILDMDIIAPVLLNVVNIDWQSLSKVQPNIDINVVPRKHRRLFRDSHQTTNSQSSEINTSPRPLGNETNPSPANPRYNLRSRRGRTSER